VQLDFFQTVVSLLLIVHVKNLRKPDQMSNQEGNPLTLISLRATITLLLACFALNTYENFPWPKGPTYLGHGGGLGLTNELLNVETVDDLADKVGDFVCALHNLGAHDLNLITGRQ
jgi:hypothetical protein